MLQIVERDISVRPKALSNSVVPDKLDSITSDFGGAIQERPMEEGYENSESLHICWKAS